MYRMEYHILVSMMCGFLVHAMGKHVSSDGTSLIQQCHPILEYFNWETGRCEMCSMCIDDKVVIQPCTRTTDTVCGSLSMSNIDTLKEIAMRLNSAESRKQESPNSKSSAPNKRHSTQSVPVELLKDNKWFTFSMVILGILCLVCLSVLAYIGFACFVCKKKPENKEIILRGGAEFLRRYPVSEEPRYVEVLQNPFSKYRINAHESLSLSGLAPVSPGVLPKTNIYVNMLDYLPADDDYVYIDDFEE